MYECPNCESLIPPQYDICPICGTKLIKDKKYYWKVKPGKAKK